jgi:hypothetical protein
MPSDQRLKWLLGEIYNARDEVRAAVAIMEPLFAQEKAPDEFREHLPILRTRARELDRRDAERERNKGAGIPPADEGPPPLNPWRMLAIGFGGGILVALLLSWQLRELQRRRQRALAHRS